MAGTMHIEVNLVKCQGYANCVIEAPELFDLDEATGKVVLLAAEVPADLEEEVRRAESSCPVRAIVVHE